MAVLVTTVGIVLTLFVYLINGQDVKSTVVFSPSELMRDIHLVNNSLKLALRYGFQQTQACRDFSKAFICVQKCLDLGFDVARSDRHCFCTCFHKRGKAKKTTPSLFTKTKWRLGAPTTKLPFWASTRKEDQKLKHNETVDAEYVLVDGNMSDVTDQTDKPTGETETLGTGDVANTTDGTGEVNTGQDAGNATSGTGATENETGQSGGTDNPKDAVTGTGKAEAGTGKADAGTGKADAGTGTGNADAGTKGPGNATGGTNAPGTGDAQNATKPNDAGAPTGGTEKPKGDATTVA